MNERERLLRAVQVSDFTLHEAVLYLDGHPYSKKALDYYDKQRTAYADAVQNYERAFGPLTYYSNNDPDRWRWIDNPWPWEGED